MVVMTNQYLGKCLKFVGAILKTKSYEKTKRIHACTHITCRLAFLGWSIMEECAVHIFPYNLFFFVTDVNECLNSRCEHTCTNTHGSFTCSCHSCYTKVGYNCDLRQCKISNQCYSYGAVNPSNQCQVRWEQILKTNPSKYVRVKETGA